MLQQMLKTSLELHIKTLLVLLTETEHGHLVEHLPLAALQMICFFLSDLN